MEQDKNSIGVMNEIITNISRTLSIPISDIKSKSRKRELVEARVIFINFCEKAGVPYEMAINFINRHRTTIYHLRKVYSDWQSDLEFQKLLAKFDESEKNEMCEEKQKYVDFFMWFRENGERYLGLSIEKLVDKYFENVERKD